MLSFSKISKSPGVRGVKQEPAEPNFQKKFNKKPKWCTSLRFCPKVIFMFWPKSICSWFFDEVIFVEVSNPLSKSWVYWVTRQPFIACRSNENGAASSSQQLRTRPNPSSVDGPSRRKRPLDGKPKSVAVTRSLCDFSKLRKPPKTPSSQM